MDKKLRKTDNDLIDTLLSEYSSIKMWNIQVSHRPSTTKAFAEPGGSLDAVNIGGLTGKFGDGANTL